jgi:hypothetical protein
MFGALADIDRQLTAAAVDMTAIHTAGPLLPYYQPHAQWDQGYCSLTFQLAALNYSPEVCTYKIHHGHSTFVLCGYHVCRI